MGSFWVPESENPDDDKVFFFFRETAVEAQGLGKSTYSRIGQLCRVRAGASPALAWTRDPNPAKTRMFLFYIRMTWAASGAW